MFLDIFSSTIAAISLIVSIRVYFINKRISVAAFEQSCYVAIDNALSAYHSAKQDAVAFEDDSDHLADTMQETYYSAMHSVLSAYDVACMNYYKKAINQKAFSIRFSAEIAEIGHSQPFKDVLAADNRYANIKKFLQDVI